jgi:nitric oxide reductase large subunit
MPRLNGSRFLLQGAILRLSILGTLAYLVYPDQPPIPESVVTGSGQTILTRADTLDGMNVFQRYGIVRYRNRRRRNVLSPESRTSSAKA